MLLIASFEDEESQHDVDRVLGLQLGLDRDSVIHPVEGASGDDALSSFTRTRWLNPLCLPDPSLPREEDLAADTTSAPRGEFALRLCGVYD